MTLSVAVYEQFSTTSIYDNADGLENAVITFETFYPGGIFGSGEIFVPVSPFTSWLIANPRPYRFQVYNGQNIVYEGWKSGDVRRFSLGGVSGFTFPLTGAWGDIAGRRSMRRLWIDRRIGAENWPSNPAPGDPWRSFSYSSDAGTGLIFTAPTGVDVTNGQYRQALYNAPTGEFIKYLSYTYDLTSVNNEDFSLLLYDVLNTSNIRLVSRTTTGTTTASVTETLAPVSNSLGFRMRSDAAQTVAQDATSKEVSYLEIISLRVHAETNNTAGYAATLGDIAEDIQLEHSAWINAETAYRSANTEALYAFITESGGFEYVNSIMNRLAQLGDADNDPWAAGFLASTKAGSWDGKPVMYYEQQPNPDSDTPDYLVSLEGENLTGDVEIVRDYENIANDIRVRYTNQYGTTRFYSSDDNSSLKDQSSIDRWGIRNRTVDAPAAATISYEVLNVGIREKLRWRYSEYKMRTPFTVRGYIEGYNGNRIQASEIRAGKLVRITDFVSDNLGSTGANTTFLITRTQYNDQDETCTITCGRPETLDVIAAKLRNAEQFG